MIESDLRESEDRYKRLFESAPVCVFVHAAGKIVMINAAGAALYAAASPEQMIGMAVADLAHPDYRALVEQRIHDVTYGRVALPVGQVRNLRLDGAVIDVEVTSLPFEYRGREAVLTMIVDVTARKAAEARVNRLTALYAALSRTNDAIVREPHRQILCDTVCRILVESGGFVSAVIRMHDRDSDMLVPFGHFGPMSGWIGERSITRTEKYSAMAEAVREMRRYVCNDIASDPITLPSRADAARAGVRAVAVFPLSRSGAMVGALSIFAADVGHFDDEIAGLAEEIAGNLSFAFSKLASEAALKDSEARYRTLVETSPDCILVHSEGRVVMINPAGLDLHGARKPADMLGRPVKDFIHPDSRARKRSVAASDEPAPRQEQVFLRLDGTPVDVEVTSTRFEYQGKPAVQLIARDIGLRKEAERTILELNADLERRVRDRTSALEAANQALGEFSYIVSHDLKAPLRGIASLVNWLQTDYADKFDGEGRTLLRLLSERSRRMHQMVEDILRYARVGRTREAVDTLDLNRLLAEVVDSLDVPAHIAVRVQAGLPEVSGDETRMRQVFQNLLSNAIGFSDKPRGEIAVGCEAHGEFWLFSVTDNGPGIDPKHHARIFELFQTLARTDESDSTGIGLAIVKKIVELHGGTIGVRSSPGAGACFHFTWPRRAPREGAAAVARTAGEHREIP